MFEKISTDFMMDVKKRWKVSYLLFLFFSKKNLMVGVGFVVE